MPNLKFQCPVCNGFRFQFSVHNAEKKLPHGAVCATCGERLTASMCIPTSKLVNKVTG